MRHSHVSRVAVSILGLALMGDNCSTHGPQARSFAAGSLVIPMDDCYQRRTPGTAWKPAQTTDCNVSTDDGIFRAYGLVYFLLKHNVPVYWAIDGATPKATVTGVDVMVAPSTTTVVVKRYDWASGNVLTYDAPGCANPGTCPYPPNTGISYIGGPFIIDQGNAAAAIALFQSNPDFASFKSQAMVDIHEVEVGFAAPQVRPLVGPPPKLAILNINPQPYHKTSADVMYRYAVAAGLDNTSCTPDAGNCLGGLGPSCNEAAVYAYLNDTLCPSGCSAATCSACNAGWVSPAITTAKFNHPGTPGSVYDVLCDGDFVSASGNYADTVMAKGNYKLLWAPHWDTGKVDPVTAAGTTLDKQLLTISSFVSAGNNLFAECAAISALETGMINGDSTDVLKGIPQTRFQSTAGMYTSSSNAGTVSPFPVPQNPDVQVGDFAYSQAPNGGAVTNYYPDPSVSSTFRNGVQVLITSVASPATTWDIATTYQNPGEGGGGTVAYLGGHDYSPGGNGGSTAPAITAGTRIVLNTLFNLGFACADPNTPCNTGLLGVCAVGTLKCSSSGGLVCVQTTFPSPETCDGLDNNCNGLVDEGGVCNPPLCNTGDTRPCYDGPAGTQGVGPCKAGVETCTSGVWGACVGEVVPQPEVCNGKDDNCNGQVDEGTLCPTGSSCNNGMCVTTAPCGTEGAACPAGYTCNSNVSPPACVPSPCPTAACPAGQTCQGSTCADLCATMSAPCGSGASCSGGVCMSGCSLVLCPAGSVCSAGQCIPDPCAGVTCPTGTFCRGDLLGGVLQGDCVRSCAYVECPSGETCSVDGFCQSSGCAQTCGQNQICLNGSCVDDPCKAVTCAQGQVCQAGTCIDDPCQHVVCGGGASCSGAQCTGGNITPSTGTAQAPKGSASGGCSSLGGTEAAGLGLLGLAFGPRLGRRRRAGRSRRALPALAALALALGLSACGKSGSSCPSGQVNCGSGCTDTATDPHNCGACGISCSQGFTCQGGCAFSTSNPFLQSIDPSSLAPGRLTTFNLAGQGIQAGAVARFTGAGMSSQVPVSVNGLTSASVTVDLTNATVGTMEVRLLNPNPSGGASGLLASNVLPVSLNGNLVLLAISPGSVLQDSTAPATVSLNGVGFASGMTASLAMGGGPPIALSPVVSSSTSASVVLPAANTLAIGLYDLAVKSPGGNSSSLKFQVNEGTPVVSSVLATTKNCMAVGTYVVATVSGQYLYPTSVAHVTGPGIQDSVLPTTCTGGSLVLGQCPNGALAVQVDLTQTNTQTGTYTLTIVNPGYPNPLPSAGTSIAVKSTCP
ncbi:MAG TPA: MopE-related protein [Anaeromyxobacteraceae bacterium]|nr:MopE-related protein [Anaeromyxobacteraceae bacterium]